MLRASALWRCRVQGGMIPLVCFLPFTFTTTSSADRLFLYLRHFLRASEVQAPAIGLRAFARTNVVEQELVEAVRRPVEALCFRMLGSLPSKLPLLPGADLIWVG